MADNCTGKINLLVTFYSVSAALYAQKLLAAEGTRCEVVPVPREVSSSCGYALDAAALPQALIRLMNAAAIEWEAPYRSAPRGGAGFALLEANTGL